MSEDDAQTQPPEHPGTLRCQASGQVHLEDHLILESQGNWLERTLLHSLPCSLSLPLPY